MDEKSFDGTWVLEKLAEIGKPDAFYEAIDSDDFERARLLMKRANLEADTIAAVLKKMEEADGEL